MNTFYKIFFSLVLLHTAFMGGRFYADAQEQTRADQLSQELLKSQMRNGELYCELTVMEISKELAEYDRDVLRDSLAKVWSLKIDSCSLIIRHEFNPRPSFMNYAGPEVGWIAENDSCIRESSGIIW